MVLGPGERHKVYQHRFTFFLTVVDIFVVYVIMTGREVINQKRDSYLIKPNDFGQITLINNPNSSYQGSVLGEPSGLFQTLGDP